MEILLGNKYGYIKTDIDIIYDVEKAKQHKQKIDNDVIKFKEKIQKRTIKEIIIVICAAIIATIMVITKMTYLLAMLGAISFLPIIIYIVISRLNEYALEPSNDYTSDIKYYLETENKKILSIKVEPTFNNYWKTVRIVTENTDHSTNKTELNFKVIEKTNLNHIILNVNEEVVYIPYKRD